MDGSVPPFCTSHGQLIGRLADAPARMTINKLVSPLAVRSRAEPWDPHGIASYLPIL